MNGRGAWETALPSSSKNRYRGSHEVLPLRLHSESCVPVGEHSPQVVGNHALGFTQQDRLGKGIESPLGIEGAGVDGRSLADTYCDDVMSEGDRHVRAAFFYEAKLESMEFMRALCQDEFLH